jgi:hypothetical protein
MIEVFVIGKSIEGRDIKALKIHSPGSFNSSKAGFWFHSCQHARYYCFIYKFKENGYHHQQHFTF